MSFVKLLLRLEKELCSAKEGIKKQRWETGSE
jgi:hypothetical protein